MNKLLRHFTSHKTTVTLKAAYVKKLAFLIFKVRSSKKRSVHFYVKILGVLGILGIRRMLSFHERPAVLATFHQSPFHQSPFHELTFHEKT